MGSAGAEGEILCRHATVSSLKGRLIFHVRQCHGAKEWGRCLPSASSSTSVTAGEETDSVKKSPCLPVPSCDTAGLAAAFLVIDGKWPLV